MADISKYIRDLYKDSAELSDLVGILQELVDRIEALETQQKAAYKLGRNAGLEEAKRKCCAVKTAHATEWQSFPADPKMVKVACIAAIESLKDNTP